MISTRTGGESSSRGNAQATVEPSLSRVVAKPVPKRQKENARSYQIEQIKKRHSAKESGLSNGESSLVFSIKPSDPDFPFELTKLECELRVPARYPSHPARMKVRNTDIPRGFALNIEKGWDKLVAEKRGATLLSLTNALDKNLEAFLSEKKVETVKLTLFKDTRHLDGLPAPRDQVAPVPATTTSSAGRAPYVPEESFSKDQIVEAKARRASEVRQLEARMGHSPLYQKSGDGVIYSLPLEPKRRYDLPPGLQPVKSFQLIIPLLYPLDPLLILLNEVESRDAEVVEEFFTQRATEQKQMTLMSHVNYLTHNIHVLAKQTRVEAAKRINIGPAHHLGDGTKEVKHAADLSDDRSHIHVIPRPPEWDVDHDLEVLDLSTSDSETDDWDEDDDEDDEEGGAHVHRGQPSQLTHGAERGTAISFPSIRLHGIELLQIDKLSLNVKCERCKTVNEVVGLQNTVEKAVNCKKCATSMTVRFRQELMHQNSTRAGFVDVTACTVSDLLPSTFIPTCANCSTPSPGLVSVRGETVTNVCRECHSRFTFALPDIKLQQYTPGQSSLVPNAGPRRRQEKLGLHAGEELASRGSCAHYKKSYRWFRFSCCSKVYPCDVCHDEAEDHVNEWANRMICGFCSREQTYHPESCGFCGRSVIGKRGKGYWEGGKGTRNKTLMRRGDKRKYRRVGGGEASKKKDD